MKNVYFGLALQYDDGVQAAISINRNGTIVEVHKSQSHDSLWYHVGSSSKMSVDWGQSNHYDSGVTPSCALNAHGQVVEVHKSEGNAGLWFHVGTVNGRNVHWSKSQHYDTGITPSVAMNDAGVVVEVHQSQANAGLWFHVGTLSGDTVHWSSSRHYDSGNTPRVALNNRNLVVEVHKSEWDSGLWYHVGRVNGDSIAWGPSIQYDSGIDPSVALTDDGLVIEVHRSQTAGTLWRRVGQVRDNSIEWSGGAVYFDDGSSPTVACAGQLAIQTHQSENFGTLWFSTSFLANRADWMHDSLGVLQDKPVKQLALPASHDSAMYLHGAFETFGKTQDLDLYGQLSYGIRYFDLRPGWDGDELHIYHGPIKGPKLTDVLAGVQGYMREGHRELVILKFSHYEAFNDKVYVRLTEKIQSYLGAWLLSSPPTGQRLAEVPLGRYISDAAVVLVVCDESYPVRLPVKGIWVYRDWQSGDAAAGDLRVFDLYSDSMSYATMSSDQLKKFADYNGKCKLDQSLPCDLFLLSWTLTPPTAVWPFSKEANRHLGGVMGQLKLPNQFGYVPNLLYVDYVEYARVTDVAIAQNVLADLG